MIWNSYACDDVPGAEAERADALVLERGECWIDSYLNGDVRVSKFTDGLDALARRTGDVFLNALAGGVGSGVMAVCDC